MAPLVAFQLPSEGIRVARDIAAVVQAEMDIETLAFAGAVVEESEVVVVVDSVEFAVQDILQAALPASTVFAAAPWEASVVPVWEVLLRLVAAGHQMTSGAWEAFRVDWAMAAGAHWVGQSFASVVYLLP